MLIKTIVDEDFSNYKFPAMFISTCFCDFKCCIEQNLPLSTCQNQSLYSQPNIDIPIETIFNRYINNPITHAIVIGGFEPMLQFDDVFNVIRYFRKHNCQDDIIIYTGYYHHEIEEKIIDLKQFDNIIIKYGRFIPNDEPHYDEILGINLISNNQYSERIS
jgi:organic radical activating enzyme